MSALGCFLTISTYEQAQAIGTIAVVPEIVGSDFSDPIAVPSLNSLVGRQDLLAVEHAMAAAVASGQPQPVAWRGHRLSGEVQIMSTVAADSRCAKLRVTENGGTEVRFAVTDYCFAD